MTGCSCPLCDPDDEPVRVGPPPRSRVAVVASLPSCCGICGGKEEVQLRGVPEGNWVRTRCPHCRPTGVPYFPLPWHEDTERNTA